MIMYLLYSPIAIYIIASATEYYLKRIKDYKESDKYIERDNLFVFRYGIVVAPLTVVLGDYYMDGFSLNTVIFIVLSILVIMINAISYFRYYKNSHVYQIRVVQKNQYTKQKLNQFNNSDDSYNIRIPMFGPPRLIIRKSNYNQEESIIRKILNIKGIFNN